ncbi:MAG TPA: DUF427 domain-containing protein [Flavobacteriales bacterium]|nr:DUF427 domain-containing protein [Flavobacteriales bacterium]
MKAVWNDAVLAESKDIVNIEGNPYFPESSINKQYFKPSDTHTECHWKGTASYYDIHVNGEVNKDACWYYPEPKELAKSIKGRVAFWKGVKIVNT